MSNIAKAFENGKAFIPFITCGDPDLETTGRIIREAVKNGADLLELGIPFSDPTAEGAVIQRANKRALENGITTDKIFDFLRELSSEITIPLVLMTYANVVFSYGAERFVRTCAETGVDGIIITDLPFEEKGEFLPFCTQYGVDLISMIAPTSKDRISMIAKQATGFVYIMSGIGARGVNGAVAENLPEIVRTIRENTDIPCAIGFGEPTAEQAKEFAAVADGIISGSALVEVIEKGGDVTANAGEYVNCMKKAVRS